MLLLLLASYTRSFVQSDMYSAMCLRSSVYSILPIIRALTLTTHIGYVHTFIRASLHSNLMLSHRVKTHTTHFIHVEGKLSSPHRHKKNCTLFRFVLDNDVREKLIVHRSKFNRDQFGPILKEIYKEQSASHVDSLKSNQFKHFIKRKEKNITNKYNLKLVRQLLSLINPKKSHLIEVMTTILDNSTRHGDNVSIFRRKGFKNKN